MYPIRFLAVYAQKYSREEITSSDIAKKNIVSIFFSKYTNLLDKIFINKLIIIIILFLGSNIIIQQQPTITKREIQDFLKPTEQIYDYEGKYINI